jgi:hypothetical protein
VSSAVSSAVSPSPPPPSCLCEGPHFRAKCTKMDTCLSKVSGMLRLSASRSGSPEMYLWTTHDAVWRMSSPDESCGKIVGDYAKGIIQVLITIAFPLMLTVPLILIPVEDHRKSYLDNWVYHVIVWPGLTVYTQVRLRCLEILGTRGRGGGGGHKTTRANKDIRVQEIVQPARER